MRAYIQTIILSLIFIFSSAILHGQIKYVNLITGSWNEGILENNKVIEIKHSRGGTSSLIFNKDSSLIYNGAINCGFGSKRKGTWSLNTSQNTITYNFNEIIGYLNNPDPKLYNKTGTYKIKRLNSLELILIGIRDDIPFKLYFFRK